MRKRNGYWMQTYTGRPYWPADPLPEDVGIDDIAHHLSLLCRYTGAVKKFYSVAEHSVHVSRLVPKQYALIGLLHDASEAYLNDISRPVKHGVGMGGYRKLEDKNWLAIARHFNLPAEIPPEVHRIDNEMLFHEKAAGLLPPTPHNLDWGMGLTPPNVLRADIIKCWSWQDSEWFFMRRYLELMQCK